MNNTVGRQTGLSGRLNDPDPGFGALTDRIEKDAARQQDRVGYIGTASQAQAAQNRPKEPSICDRAQALCNYIQELSDEQDLTRSKLFAEGSAQAPPGNQLGPVSYSLEQLVAIACERVAILVGEARMINARL